MPGRRVEMTAHRVLFAGMTITGSSRHYIAASLLFEPMMRRPGADLGENHDPGGLACFNGETEHSD